MACFWNKIFFLIFGSFVVVAFHLYAAACFAQEKITLKEQEDYFNRAFNSIYVGFQKIPDEEAVSLLRVSAENGHARSQWFLGTLYEDGKAGLQQNMNTFVLWMERSANQGFLNAELRMAEAYLYSEGVDEDVHKAFSYIQKAAEKGHPLAINLLAVFFAQGVQVEQDLGRAQQLLERANNLYNNEKLASNLKEKFGGPITIHPVAEKIKNLRLAVKFMGFDENVARLGNVEEQVKGAFLYTRVMQFDEGLKWGWAASMAGNLPAQQLYSMLVAEAKKELPKEKIVDGYVAASRALESLKNQGIKTNNNIEKIALINRYKMEIRKKMTHEECMEANNILGSYENKVFVFINGEFVAK